MTAVILNNVSKRFGDFDAVKELSFEVKEGSIFGFLGPNGAGKTTTIRMIVDILAPDTGEITIFGQRASAKLKHMIGYLPEERGLYKDLKVGALLNYFAILKKIPETKAGHLVDDWLARLELSEWKDKEVEKLSKGMSQKVQFIIAVISQPKLLILDEPFSGLDPVSTKLLKDEIRKLNKAGTTIIFSNHQMEQVEQLCDDICMMNKGRKVLSGSPREVKRRFGAKTLILDYQGSDGFLNNPMVKDVNKLPTHSEVHLIDGADEQELLKQAVSENVKITRFEKVEPSLNDIFISIVRGEN